MKKILAMLLCTAAVVCGMSSCLGDDDNGPTLEEIQSAMRELGGTYEGYMVYAPSQTIVPDTVRNMQWTIDSVLTIKAFPQNVLVKSFSESVDSSLLADVKALPAKDLKCYIGFYSVGENGYTMNVMPHSIKFTAMKGEKAHDCEVVFMSHNDQSLGVYQKSNKHLEFMMNTYGLMMDSVLQDNNLFKVTYFKLVSTSKH
jgi:hypothetical protein